ncbi:hypothetical protein [Reyranella sp.]|uniref:hypothetical protein n=1 Tax=Reyranella sp. TaxID=1929291 RepID=UPI003D13E5AA
MRKALALSFILLLSACETPNDQARTWIGQPASQLMAARGAPDLESRAAGGRVMTWNRRMGTLICRYNFTADARDIIVAANSDCPLIP